MDEAASTELAIIATAELIPAFAGGKVAGNARQAIAQAVNAWLLRTPSVHTRTAYEHDLNQFLVAAGIEAGAFEQLPNVRPEHVAAWRGSLTAVGMNNSSIRRKLTALRSLFSYLQIYGLAGPTRRTASSSPPPPSPGMARRWVCHPTIAASSTPTRGSQGKATPVDLRDRAMLAVLAYSGCRVGELIRLRVRDYKQSGEHRILNITGKGGKERTTPLHLEAVERLAQWLAVPKVMNRGE